MHVYYSTVRDRIRVIIGFAIWPDLATTQLLNIAIKTRPRVSQFAFFGEHNSGGHVRVNRLKTRAPIYARIYGACEFVDACIVARCNTFHEGHGM